MKFIFMVPLFMSLGLSPVQAALGCEQQCAYNNPDDLCFQLGTRTSSAVTHLREIYGRLLSQPTQIIPISDCQRTITEVGEKLFSSGNVCLEWSTDLEIPGTPPQPHTQGSWFWSELPEKIEAVLENNNLVSFPNVENQIRFVGQSNNSVWTEGKITSVMILPIQSSGGHREKLLMKSERMCYSVEL